MNATTRLDAKVAADCLGRVRPRLDVIAPGSSVHVPRSRSALPPKATETAISCLLLACLSSTVSAVHFNFERY